MQFQLEDKSQLAQALVPLKVSFEQPKFRFDLYFYCVLCIFICIILLNSLSTDL